MKKLFLSAMVLFSTVVLFAQSEKYNAAMKKNLAAMDTSFKNPADLLTLSNNFERIAVAEKTQWLPYYYAAFCQVNYGFMLQDKEKVDGFADRAAMLIAQADSISPNNSEIYCIKSMIATCHMLVNPQQRWQQYGTESSSNLQVAIKLDPSNPRPYYLQGQTLVNTPEQFGGGCKTAKPVLEKAMEKYGSFKPATDISPDWGKQQVEAVLKTCQ